MRQTVLFLAMCTLILLLVACEPAARSASQAMDNANSAIKTTGDKLFVEGEATPVPSPRERY